jgi:hypothetical protein
MDQNIKQFLKQTSESQKLFKWTGRGYKITKGRFSGKLINDMYQEEPEFTIEFLDNILEDENCNYHTKLLIEEVKEMLLCNNS